MPTWRPTFLVEPFPDTPWDRRALERWRQTDPGNDYVAVAKRRSVQISLAIEADEEGTAITAGRAQVDASFPSWRYNVQNPPAPGVSLATKQALAAGVAAHLRRTGPQWFDDGVPAPEEPALELLPGMEAPRRPGRLS